MRDAIYNAIEQLQAVKDDYLCIDDKIVIEKAISVLQQASKRKEAERKRIKQRLEKLVGERICVMTKHELTLGTLTKVKGSFAIFEDITVPTDMQGRTWCVDMDMIIGIRDYE